MIFNANEYDKLLKYVKTILELNKDSDEHAYEILISDAGYDNAVKVDVNQYNYKYEEQDHFRLVESDQLLMKEYMFPDNHYEYFSSDEEYKDYFEAWLESEAKEGRKYSKNQFGFWRLEEEAD